MEFLFGWLVLGAVPGIIAHYKGKTFLFWWIYGFWLFPIALVHVLLMGGNYKQMDDRKLRGGGFRKCPKCAELVRSDAEVCRFCSHSFGIMRPGGQANLSGIR